MEYASSGHFVDKPTVVIKKREWPKVDVQVKKGRDWLTVRTLKLTLRYRLHSGRFTDHNLKVTWRDSIGAHRWYPGKKDSLNLGGVLYDLRSVRRGAIPTKKQLGLLSRSGWAMIKDSYTPLWDEGKQWIIPRKQKNNQDWYLFIYGHNYQNALQKYAKLSGSIPMVPRYALGLWITDMGFQYFPCSYKSKQPYVKRYNVQHLKKEILQFYKNKIPIDGLILDYAWHNYGWQGGYDWSPLIPKPKQFLSWLHHHGIHMVLNDHPGYPKIHPNMSLLSYKDSHALEVLKDLGKEMSDKNSFSKDISEGWQFSIDAHDRGLVQHWYLQGKGNHWKAVNHKKIWAYQNSKNYKGIVWYRKSIQLPPDLPDSLYFYLGRVKGNFHIYVNGHRVVHHKVPPVSTVRYANITSYIKAGQSNVIAIRVVGSQNQVTSGITRAPVAIKNHSPLPPIRFDLSNKKQAEVFWDDLHKSLVKEGISFWWVDGANADMPGLNKQMWTNRVYYVFNQKTTGNRSFIFSRYGGWGSQRYPAFFTGDAYSQWPVLAYEVAMTARGGNVLEAYITNDIGGYHGAKIDFDLYARWVEFGTFSPILRLHSHYENPNVGNLRMPWTYGEKGMDLAQKYFRLRSRLIPYIYTYTRIAHDKTISLLRPLYLQYPNLRKAYKHPHEYFFGKQMLVAPIIRPTTKRTIYLPPGHWINFFTGEKYNGDQMIKEHYDVDQIPVFVREGSIIPEQPSRPHSSTQALDTVIVNIYGSENGSFNLYNDDGISFRFKKDEYAWTKMEYSTQRNKHKIIIGPTKGSFHGQVKKRSYQIHIHSISNLQSVSVNGKYFSKWKWKKKSSIAVINLPKQSIRHKIKVKIE
jgi:alpha-glucosidase (family GH31 glycosyl hydrolase)